MSTLIDEAAREALVELHVQLMDIMAELDSWDWWTVEVDIQRGVCEQAALRREMRDM